MIASASPPSVLEILWVCQLPKRTEAVAPSGTVRSRLPVRGSRSDVSKWIVWRLMALAAPESTMPILP